MAAVPNIRICLNSCYNSIPQYTDGSVTLKACAGLNGMKLGGSVITAVCALPDASSVTVIQ